MPRNLPQPHQPRRDERPQAPRRGEPQVRITMYPASHASRPLPVEHPWEGPARWIALTAAAFLMIGTVGWAPLRAGATHALSDYHYWAGREAFRRGDAQIVVQREWQAAIALDPKNPRIRLDLARAYIDAQWLGGAILQSQAVLDNPHSRADASLAYTYLGYSHYMLGQKTEGETELELAVTSDPQNALAQSVLERLRRDGKLSQLTQ